MTGQIRRPSSNVMGVEIVSTLHGFNGVSTLSKKADAEDDDGDGDDDDDDSVLKSVAMAEFSCHASG